MKSTPIARPSDLDCAYLAGLIDGEGSISASISSRDDRRRPGGRYALTFLRLDVTNTDKRMIDWIGDRWLGVIHTQDRSAAAQKDIWRFTATNSYLPPVLLAVRPYLVIKREQAEIAAELVRTANPRGRHYAPDVRERRLELAIRLQELNLKGTRPRGARRYGRDPGGYPPGV